MANKGKSGNKKSSSEENDSSAEDYIVAEDIFEYPYSLKVRNLRGKKYVVRPIKRKGQWVGVDHDSSFMNDGAKLGIVVPVLPGNVLVNPMKEFTKEDVLSFSNELGLPDVQKLNIHVPKSYWRGKTVNLNRNGLFLELSRIDHFVQFLILRSDTERIAQSWSERFDKGTYKFALVEEGEELRDNVDDLEEKTRAYILFNKMNSNVVKMRDFLYIYYLEKKDAKRPPKNATLDQLKKEIGRIIEDDRLIYLSILDDDYYNLKLLIQKSVEIGSLKRNGHLYSLPGADKPIGVLSDLLVFLDDTKNQDVRMKLLHQIENV
jgi:hypothetical protein